jgi:hypothetical protein
MNYKTLPDALKLEEGLSNESIAAKLKNANIPFDVEWGEGDWKISHRYFRESTINVLRSDIDYPDLDKILGEPDNSKGGNYFYYGKYKGFDFSRFSGTVTFDKGHLVEATRIKVWR